MNLSLSVFLHHNEFKFKCFFYTIMNLSLSVFLHCNEFKFNVFTL